MRDEEIAHWASRMDREVRWMSSADVGTNVRVGILAAQMGEPAATQFIQELNNLQDPIEVMNLAAAKLNSLGILRKMNCLRL